MKLLRLSLLGILILTTGCLEKTLEKDITILQQKKVIRIEIRDIETGSGDVYALKDAREISRMIPLLNYPCDQLCQMSYCAEIIFEFEDGSKALCSFNYDGEQKKLYLAGWVFDHPELWSLFKKHFGVQEDVKHFVLKRKSEDERQREMLSRIAEINEQILKLTAEKRHLQKTWRELREEIKNKSNN